MSQQSDELKKYFDQHGILQREIAERLGVHEGTVSNILSGRFGISKNIARKLAVAYDFDLEFLLTGEGVLCPPPGTVRIQRAQRVTGNGNIVNGAGTQTITGDQALVIENAQLRDQLEQCREEKDRLLGIIETLTKR